MLSALDGLARRLTTALEPTARPAGGFARFRCAACTRDDGEIIWAGDVQTPGIPSQIFRDRPPLWTIV